MLRQAKIVAPVVSGEMPEVTMLKKILFGLLPNGSSASNHITFVSASQLRHFGHLVM